MGKLCAIVGCGTGRYADVTRRKKLGLRQKTFFGIPKRNNALVEWRIATGQRDLSMTDFICELHFSEESIIKEDRFTMPDNTIHVIPRQKYTLVPTAVPMIIGNKAVDILQALSQNSL